MIKDNVLKDKIGKIDSILNNESALNKYIDEINCKEIEVPNNLNKKIISNINKRKFSFPNILKIAACTIFAIIVWEMYISKDTYAKNITTINETQKNVFTNIDNAVKSMNDFLNKPIHGLESEVKK